MRPLVLLLLAGCASGPLAEFRPVAVTVDSRAVRGDFLDAVVYGERLERRLFFRDTEKCRAVLREGETVTFHPRGLLGRLTAEGTECVPVGTASLRHLRASRPRRPGLRGHPREPATFQVVQSDEAFVFVRGRFVLAGLLDWPRGDDTIAVVPNTPECAPALARGRAQTEFHQSGTHPLLLISDGGYCPIEGLIKVTSPRGPPPS